MKHIQLVCVLLTLKFILPRSASWINSLQLDDSAVCGKSFAMLVSQEITAIPLHLSYLMHGLESTYFKNRFNTADMVLSTIH